MVLLNDFKGASRDQLIEAALLRAKFCETLCTAFGDREGSFSAYLTGMFSVMDAILNCPIETVIRDLYLPAEVRDVLLGKDTFFHELLELAISYERSEWANVLDHSE
ncbi:MAG: histidine kinase, partial [Bacillota bacterium]|nr:histidine kinase [Bacillota bacterium]